MVNRQDTPRSPRLQHWLPAPTGNFDGTKLPMVAEPSQNHTYRYELLFSLYSISQNRACRSLAFAAEARSIDPRWPHELIFGRS